MKFIDLKLVLIIFLMIVVYFLYKEILNIKKNFKLFLENEINYNQSTPPPIKISTSSFPINLNFLEELFPFINNPNLNEDLNIPNDEDYIKKIITEQLNNINNDDVVLSEDNIEPTIDNKNVVVNENNKNDIDLNILINDDVNNGNDEEEEEEDEEDEDDKHLEVYSNDTENKQKKTDDENEYKIEKKVPDISNLNKYKLPELQDIAIQYSISLSNNLKKKTKNELINDIKKHITNKNI